MTRAVVWMPAEGEGRPQPPLLPPHGAQQQRRAPSRPPARRQTHAADRGRRCSALRPVGGSRRCAAAAKPYLTAAALLLPRTFPRRRQVLGYVYPAYRTFKVVQLPATRANDTLLRKWCCYWCLMAALTAVQPVLDTFLFWVRAPLGAGALPCCRGPSCCCGGVWVLAQQLQLAVVHPRAHLAGNHLSCTACCAARRSRSIMRPSWH